MSADLEDDLLVRGEIAGPAHIFDPSGAAPRGRGIHTSVFTNFESDPATVSNHSPAL